MAGHRNHGNSVSRLPDGYPSGGKVSVAQDRGPEEPDELNKPKRITVGRHGVIGAEQPRRRAALIIACIKAAEEAVPLPRTARVAGGPTVTFHLPVCWMASMAMPPATMSCVAPIAEALVKEEAVRLAGFGTFRKKSRAARSGRKPICGGAWMATEVCRQVRRVKVQCLRPRRAVFGLRSSPGQTR